MHYIKVTLKGLFMSFVEFLLIFGRQSLFSFNFAVLVSLNEYLN